MVDEDMNTSRDEASLPALSIHHHPFTIVTLNASRDTNDEDRRDYVYAD
jgi:hypothetical protein